MSEFVTDIVFDEEYTDKLTGIKGKATVVCFNAYGSQVRVDIEYLKDGELSGAVLDADRLDGKKKKTKHKSEIILGDKYRDETGLEGVVTNIFFHRSACEQVQFEYVEKNDLKRLVIDAGRLTHITSAKPVEVKKAGGPPRASVR